MKNEKKKEKMVPAQTTIPETYRDIIKEAGKRMRPVPLGYSAALRFVLSHFVDSVSVVDKKGNRKFKP